MFNKIKKLADKVRTVSAKDAEELEELEENEDETEHEEDESEAHEEAESEEFEAGEHEEVKEMVEKKGPVCEECAELAGLPDSLREKILAITEKLDQEGVFEGADEVVLVMIEAAKKMRQVKGAGPTPRATVEHNGLRMGDYTYDAFLADSGNLGFTVYAPGEVTEDTHAIDIFVTPDLKVTSL